MKLEEIVRNFTQNEPAHEDNSFILAQKEYRRQRLLLESFQVLAQKIDALQLTQSEDSFDMGVMD